MMVQPYAATAALANGTPTAAAATGTGDWPHHTQSQQPAQTNGIHQTLAMPAIVAGQQQQLQQSQYSPQQDTSIASNGSTSSNQYYQQQLIKSAQQQFAVQQQQQQQQQRMNGINPSEGLYNGIGRPAPIYAPKPTYYSQQPQPVYQQTRAFYPQQQQQQQHSPANNSSGLLQQPPTTATGLSVRHLTQPLSQQNSPQQQQVQSQQPPQQMQQLIMSYQQQQQQPILSQVMQQPNYSNSNYNLPQVMQTMHSQEREQHLQQQEAGRAQIEEQHRLIQQQHLRQSARVVAATTTTTASRFSDRDSVSTVSRFNQQHDDRRSFTMRSQYTAAHQSARYSRKFGFLELSGEAVKRILGLSSSSGDKPLLQQQQSIVGDDGKSHQQPSAKITSIDSGEDYYFKRKVFKYQLVILRLVTFLCASFVLLSPVAMLLIPKLESFLSHSSQVGVEPTQDTSTVAGVVTHGVGLSNKRNGAAGGGGQYNFVPQPQWRISECTSDCDGPLIGFAARFIMLCLAYWAIFYRSQTSSLPRIDFQRCLLISMSVLVTLAYWLFFIFRVFDKRYNDFELQYMTIVQFALSMLESLILLHYLAVLMLELRQRKKIYCLKVVRSPDGASQYLSCGSLSIQKCAQFVLEKYHREFQSYTAYHEHMLELEDELAKSLSATSTSTSRGGGGELSSRSRPSSPANSTGARSAAGRRSSRHHQRRADRSPSPAPIRSASRSRSRKSTTENSSAGKYQVDAKPPQSSMDSTEESATQKTKKPAANNNNSPQEQKDNNQQHTVNGGGGASGENDSADQSSDATSRMKESSLETIRAANSTSELLSATATATTTTSAKQSKSRGQLEQQQQRDETESVRSVRSRRSARSHHHHSHHHHHHRSGSSGGGGGHHRERSSSRLDERQQQPATPGDGHEDGGANHHRRRAAAVSIPMPTAEDQSRQLEEHERKLRRRKYRLLQTVQDTFEQIRQIDEATAQQSSANQLDQVQATSNGSLQQQQQPSPALSANQAARSLYPSMARSLQKYLRLTKQTGRHNLQSIYEHLSKCILYRLSPRAFLEKFLNQDPVWQQSETNLFARCRLGDSMLPSGASHRFQHDDLEINSWSLVCDTLLSRQIDSGTFFVLKQGQISLLVTVAKLPHLNLTEEVIDSKSCKFSLAPNSETSV